MNKTIFKRIGAYLIDIMIVSIIVSLLSYIPFIYPQRTQYSEKYNELVNVFEQYNKQEISESEYQDAYVPISYELYRLNTSYVILDLVCVLLYFGVLPYFMKGQTIGKKIFYIQIVSIQNKPLSIINYILRTIVLNNILISILLLCVVHFMTSDNYLGLYENINLVGYIILYLSLFMVMVRKDARGLHDFVANTQVVLTEDKEAKIKEEEKVLESEYELIPDKKKKKKKESTKTK